MSQPIGARPRWVESYLRAHKDFVVRGSSHRSRGWVGSCCPRAATTAILFKDEPDARPIGEHVMITAGPAARYSGLRILRNLHAALESDMLECFRFVEPSLDNEAVYSVALLEIHGRACAAVDSALNLWYQELKIGKNASPSLGDYHPLLDKIGIVDTELGLQHRPDFVVRPFADWKEATRLPSWWTAHNRTKHALNDETFRLATLRNALSALGGLYLVLSDRETRGTHPITTRVFRPMW